VDQEMKERFDRQLAEFDAAEELMKHYKRIQMTAIVDDDYPEVRHGYDAAARAFVTAALLNGMFPRLSGEVRDAVRTCLEAEKPAKKKPPFGMSPCRNKRCVNMVHDANTLCMSCERFLS
jgi:hypothetical protein